MNHEYVGLEVHISEYLNAEVKMKKESFFCFRKQKFKDDEWNVLWFLAFLMIDIILFFSIDNSYI